MDDDVLRSVDPRAIGQRLRDGRTAKGLTQQDAADHLGVARTTITAIEKGQRRIRPVELVDLASCYGRSVGEFLRQSEPTPAFVVQLRAALAPHSSVEPVLRPYISEFQRLCEDYLELEHIRGAPLSRRYPVLYEMSRTAPEDVAEDVATAERNRLGLGDGPLLNLREVLESDVGLRIFYMDLPSPVAAMFAYTDDLGGCIAVNRKHPEERRRMSLAHDYGHFLTARYVSGVSLLGQYHRHPKQERFADTFAWAFLMPAAGLRRRYHELHRSRDGRVTPADLCILAHYYFTSLEALTRRLEGLRLVRLGTWDRLQDRGFRVREAQAILQLPQHRVSDSTLPTRYLYLAAEAFERGDLSEGQYARFLRVDRLEARQLAEELAASHHLSDQGETGIVPLDLGEELAALNA